ncbi:Big [Quillaja saponaria]|uniref:Big n=1 Tax=Quillaja saponaria TaxID=32244 RepID=A0AAD7KQS0_QUISA|nr:Big [Quillaja saponaria]
MKQSKVEAERFDTKINRVIPNPPPLPPPLPRFRVVTKPGSTGSVTKQEIAKFWKQKRIEEEDHLLAAIKAAARLRARNLTEEDYKLFELSLKDDEDEDDPDEENVKNVAATSDSKDVKNNEVRVGIKDWWTKSKYAYLNQPAIQSMEPPKRRTTTFIPNCLNYKPAPLYSTSVGVF